MNRPLRIVRYHRRGAEGDGGMTRAVREYARAVTALGAEVRIAYDAGDPPAGNDPRMWWHVRHVGPSAARLPVGIHEMIEWADLLVLHSGWTLHSVRAAAAARAAGTPYMLEPRGAYDPHIVARHPFRKRVWWALGEGRLVDRAAGIHVFFPEEVAHLEAIGYRGEVIVAPNGVVSPEGPRWRGRSDSYLLYLGRFDPEHKGLDLLVYAIAALPEAERPALRLHGSDWAGGRAAVEALVDSLDLRDWITVGDPVHGRVKRDLLVEASGFVYPSRWDACPNAVLEAASLGMPVLCGPYPLGAYLAERDAAVVTESSPAAIADGLLALARSGQGRELGTRAAQVCADDFAWDRVAATWLGQVERIVRAPSATISASGRTVPTGPATS